MDQSAPTPLKTDLEINSAIEEFYQTQKVKHFHENGIHECSESGRKYDIVTQSSKEYSSEPIKTFKITP